MDGNWTVEGEYKDFEICSLINVFHTNYNCLLIKAQLISEIYSKDEGEVSEYSLLWLYRLNWNSERVFDSN